jgi:hypothetical protein
VISQTKAALSEAGANVAELEAAAAASGKASASKCAAAGSGGGFARAAPRLAAPPFKHAPVGGRPAPPSAAHARPSLQGPKP